MNKNEAFGNEQVLSRIKEEYPEFFESGKPEFPEEIEHLRENGMSVAEAVRAFDLKKTKERCAQLEKRLEIETENRENAAASTGSVAGGNAAEKDFYSSQEWDRLPPQSKEKLIRNGKIFEFMKKWSVKR